MARDHGYKVDIGAGLGEEVDFDGDHYNRETNPVSTVSRMTRKTTSTEPVTVSSADPGAAMGGGPIPVVDLAPYLRGEPGARDATADAIRTALESVGFYVIVNHGVASALIESTFAEAARFHAQPLEAKMQLAMNDHNNGYMAINRYMVTTSGVSENTKPDLNEAFFSKRERSADHPGLLAGRRFVGHNQWPDLPGFREAVCEYTDTLDVLALRMLPVIATALELPPDYFAPYFDDSQFSFRMSHYPPARAEENQFGIAPHTDANFMTFVAQTSVAGLEVRLPDGEWVPVPYIENSFAVNSGDMMYRWTNGRFKSTPHRVRVPEGATRYAIPYFLGPNLDAVIECLPTCVSAGAGFPPISYEAYLNWWYDANYDASKQTT